MDASDVAAPAVIPAGWYDDPAAQQSQRWWDGGQWTVQVRAVAPAPAPAPQLVAAPYVPFQSEQRAAVSARVRGISYTRAGWWISAWPVWSIIPQAMLLAVIGALTDHATSQVSLGVSVFAFASWIAVVALGFADRAALLRGGNRTAASPWWMLLSPLLYLILRAIQVNKWDTSGWGALIWFVVASIVGPAIAVVAFFATLGLMP